MQSSEQSAPVSNEPSASDYLSELKGEVGELKKDRSELRGAVDRSNRTLERIQSAFKDEPQNSEDEEDDTGRDQKLLDMFLDAALEDQKAGGKGMPLTTKLAMETVALKKELREVRAALKDFGNRQTVTSSADYKYDQDAYSQMDMRVQDAIGSIYGGEVDEHLFEAVSKDIGKEITRLKNEKPQVWEQIRRNPEYIKRMALYFVEKKIPPRAREIMMADKEKATPMGMNELRQAFREADSIKDPRARQEIKEAIRQKTLELSFGKK
jgi:hypothetical protein